MRPSRALPGLLLVVVVAGCGAQPAAAPSRSTPSPTPGETTPVCPERVVLGFRGQGQSPRRWHGMGREAGQVARAIGGELRGVRYPSRAGSSTYDADVAAGVRAGARALRRACASSRIVLVGYSQGAEIVHRLVAAHPDRVESAVLMGDPQRDPGDHVDTVTLGTGVLDGRGNAAPGERFPAVVRRHVVEVCVRGDDVCNAPLSGRVGPPSATHRTAYQSPAAAQRIASALHQLPG